MYEVYTILILNVLLIILLTLAITNNWKIEIPVTDQHF